MRITETAIPGLLVVRLPLHEDARGWFKEAWQREKMTALGLPDFGPVQHNVSYNAARGATRGIHAEPWDKFVSVSTGRAFGAWVVESADRSGTSGRPNSRLTRLMSSQVSRLRDGSCSRNAGCQVATTGMPW